MLPVALGRAAGGRAGGRGTYSRGGVCRLSTGELAERAGSQTLGLGGDGTAVGREVTGGSPTLLKESSFQRLLVSHHSRAQGAAALNSDDVGSKLEEQPGHTNAPPPFTHLPSCRHFPSLPGGRAVSLPVPPTAGKVGVNWGQNHF